MKNTKKIFVVSDVHGHFTLLQKALGKAGFDKNNENHLIVCLGDYFDRGDENPGVMRFFERLKNKVLLRGNHEDLLLTLFRCGKMHPHNYINGTLHTLENFFGKYCIDPVDDTIDFSGHTRTVERICQFIESTENYFETESYVFVHGWFPSGCYNSAQLKNAGNAEWENARWIRWTDKYDGRRPLADKTLVCGHMPTFFAGKFDSSRKPGETDIFYGNGFIAVDAGTYDSGQVNVLVIEDDLLL